MKTCAIAAVAMLGACAVDEAPAAPPVVHPGDPDWAVVRAHFERPDGTLTAGVLAGVLRPGPANAAAALPAGEGCVALDIGANKGTCVCNVSGSWDFDGFYDAAAKTNTLRSDYHACDDGMGVVDGSQILRAEADAAFVVYAYSITANGTTNRLDAIAQAATGKDTILASKVDDGWVTLNRVSGLVRDRVGTWTCTTSPTDYSCVSADGRPTLVARR